MQVAGAGSGEKSRGTDECQPTVSQGTNAAAAAARITAASSSVNRCSPSQSQLYQIPTQTSQIANKTIVETLKLAPTVTVFVDNLQPTTAHNRNMQSNYNAANNQTVAESDPTCSHMLYRKLRIISIIMAARWNRAGNYIFALWFLSFFFFFID